MRSCEKPTPFFICPLFAQPPSNPHKTTPLPIRSCEKPTPFFICPLFARPRPKPHRTTLLPVRSCEKPTPFLFARYLQKRAKRTFATLAAGRLPLSHHPPLHRLPRMRIHQRRRPRPPTLKILRHRPQLRPRITLRSNLQLPQTRRLRPRARRRQPIHRNKKPPSAGLPSIRPRPSINPAVADPGIIRRQTRDPRHRPPQNPAVYPQCWQRYPSAPAFRSA